MIDQLDDIEARVSAALDQAADLEQLEEPIWSNSRSGAGRRSAARAKCSF